MDGALSHGPDHGAYPYVSLMIIHRKMHFLLQ